MLRKGGFVLLLILLATSVSAADQVVINSKDWQDIYSAMMYAKHNNLPASYLIEETRAYLLMDTIDPQLNDILLFESSRPYVKGFASDLKGKGFSVETYSKMNNLNLAKELETRKYIVIDPIYSYNAVSIGPYAVLEGYYVLFADSENIVDIVNYLATRVPDEIIIYGHVDRVVSQRLERFDPEVINLGSKYKNNLEIARRFLEKQTFNQYVLTNGAFLEPQFFTPNSPVVLVGNSNIPDEVMQFLKDSEIKHAVMIGNELVDIAVLLKNQAGMKIMVKFAKGINKVQYSLDTINLPVFDMRPRFNDITYNPLLKQLIVVFGNPGESPAFARATYTITDNNESIAELGDVEPFFIGDKSIATRTYDIDLSDYDFGLKVSARMVYGEEKGALDNLLLDEKDLRFVRFDDRSKIEIIDIYYDPTIKRFVIIVRNNGDSDVYLLPYLQDLLINNKLETLSGEQIKLQPGEEIKIKIKARLTPEDIEDNVEIHLRIDYGAQEDILVKKRDMDIELKIKSLQTYLIAGGVILLIAVIALLYYRRKKRKKHIISPKPHTSR